MSYRRDTAKRTRRVARHVATKPPMAVTAGKLAAGTLAKGAFTTLPILLAGSMAISLNLTGPIAPQQPKRAEKATDSTSQLRKAVQTALAQQAAANLPDAAPVAASVAGLAPSSYRVTAGDTVSGIAARYGLATASVLALNGLSWKSIIFPGQVLKLTNGIAAPTPVTPAPTASSRYTIVSGDTISGIAARHGVSTQAILTANGLGWSSIIYPGQTLAIPGAAVATPPADIVPVSNVTPIPETALSYRIKAGDTISHIAARFGVSMSALLAANGLTMSSIIYTGHTLVIPSTGSSSAAVGDAVAILTPEMEKNARTILSVGRSLGVPEYGLVIALAAAMQESTLRNLNYGDRDSLGLFQQRPSTGWGTPAQVTDPVYASRLFFGGAQNPNKGNTRGLLDISGWQSMTVTQAAQAVQRSAYPDAYAKWETSARAWLRQLS